jgi:cytochrome b pre-mRNA-processing protein 3
MDDAMREMTFGDLAIPREIKRAAAALYDRHQSYLAACAATAEPEALPAALVSELAYLKADGNIDAVALACYMREAACALKASSSEQILNGELPWPQSRRAKCVGAKA